MGSEEANAAIRGVAEEEVLGEVHTVAGEPQRWRCLVGRRCGLVAELEEKGNGVIIGSGEVAG